MTSLIFWGPYLAHKGVIHQRREKQRVKNYERWEGLRDEYDEQRKISRDSRSLDIQRTGQWDLSPSPSPSPQINAQYDDSNRGIFTLRDQQEANDARTGWRPQEVWEGPKSAQIPVYTGQGQRHASATPTVPVYLHQQQPQPQIRSQKTGATWDEGLPAPLQVSRRSFDDYDYGKRYRTASATMDVSWQSSGSRTGTPIGLGKREGESVHSSYPATPQRQASPPRGEVEVEVVSVVEQPKNEFGFVDVHAQVAGGRMAELIERGY